MRLVPAGVLLPPCYVLLGLLNLRIACVSVKRMVRPCLPSPPPGSLTVAWCLTCLWANPRTTGLQHVLTVESVLLLAKRPLLCLARFLSAGMSVSVLVLSLLHGTLYPPVQVVRMPRY